MTAVRKCPFEIQCMAIWGYYRSFIPLGYASPIYSLLASPLPGWIWAKSKTTPSTKLEVHNVSHWRQTRTATVNTYRNFWSLGVCFWAPVCKTVRHKLPDRCLSVLSVCNVGVLWPNGWTDQDETWHAGRPRLWPHYVRWGPSSPKRGTCSCPQIFGSSITAKRLDAWGCDLVRRYASAQTTLC